MTRPNLARTKSRRPIPANLTLDKQLLAYATAATAAGVGLLGTAQSAEGKIVYTAVNIPVAANAGPVAFDVNNDGVPDFALSNYLYGPRLAPLGYHAAAVTVWPKFTNEVWTVVSNGITCASALNAGVKVGPESPFTKQTDLLMWGSAGSYTYTGPGVCPWKGAHPPHAYLALKFSAKGLIHYGWARIVMKGSDVTLTGYAYESVPNQPIHTGATSGPDSALLSGPEILRLPDPHSPTLGLLAQGASALVAWRRPEENQQS